eukprot:scaffold30443_cov61-Phaeocystis_antarctica.AAC.2
MRAARPSSPNGLRTRPRRSSAGSCRKAGARATSPASVMAAPLRWRCLSRGRAPRPRAAASAEAPASPTCTLTNSKVVTEGSAPALSPSASRSTPSGPAPAELSMRRSFSSAGSTEPSLPSNARSAAVRPLSCHLASFASRSSLQLLIPTLRHRAVQASCSALSCCRSACVSAHSSLLALLKATATPGSSTLHSWVNTMRCSSSLSFESAISRAPTQLPSEVRDEPSAVKKSPAQRVCAGYITSWTFGD